MIDPKKTMITREKLRSWNACYTDEEIAAQWRRLRWPEEVWPLRLARARSLSVEDRLWVLLRPEVLGDRLHSVLGQFVDRAVMLCIQALDQAGMTHALVGLPPAGPKTYEQIVDAARVTSDAIGRAIWKTTWETKKAASDAVRRVTWSAKWSARSSAWRGTAFEETAADAWRAVRAAPGTDGVPSMSELKEQLKIVIQALGEEPKTRRSRR